MRIVGGKHRSRIINAPEGLNTRPSLDKTREAIFNIIAYYVYDANVLDIFSGSGALALEAISRGARKATLIDNNIDAIKCIKSNVELLKETDRCNIIQDDYSIISTLNETFDIILLDPPYNLNVIDEIIEMINNNDLLSENGVIVFESDEKHKIDREIEGFNLKIKKYGIAYVNILTKK